MHNLDLATRSSSGQTSTKIASMKVFNIHENVITYAMIQLNQLFKFNLKYTQRKKLSTTYIFAETIFKLSYGNMIEHENSLSIVKL